LLKLIHKRLLPWLTALARFEAQPSGTITSLPLGR
jgi:hypothetical protein